MIPPAVSVIMPTRNRPGLLRCALASVAAQTILTREPVEVIVVNDGGADVGGVTAIADAAHDVLDDLVDGARVGHLTVRLVSLPANRGLPAARNAALAAARGRWVAFLDDDDVWLPHHLDVAVAAGERSGVELVHTSCAVADQRLTADTASGWLRRSRPPLFDLPVSAAALLVLNPVPVISVVCRNPHRAGVRFDETARVQEDWRLWLDLIAGAGWRHVHVAEISAIYHRVPTMTSMTTWSRTDQGQAAAGLAQFRDGAEQVWALWPVPRRGLPARGRALVRRMYDLAGARLAAGLPVEHYYYERALPIILDGARGALPAAEAAARLEAAVAGAPARPAASAIPGPRSAPDGGTTSTTTRGARALPGKER